MRKSICKILVTGGAGFIGSAFVRLLINKGYSGGRVPVVVDKLTYAGDLARLDDVKGRYKFYKADISDKSAINRIFRSEKPDIVVHFAAETHVDRSIFDPTAFLKTNIIGTQVLVDAARKYKVGKFVHISTDEVYGDIKRGRFTEESPLKPNSPYAASKAAADLLIRSYMRTYKFPAVIIRPSNNYGPWQYPEKFIPVVIAKAWSNQRVPIFARGLNQREWLYVEDCVKAIALVVKKGKIGETYNITSGCELKNVDTAKTVLRNMNRPYKLIEYVLDRPGHDFRYALDAGKIKKIGWRPKMDFKIGINQTVAWSRENIDWLNIKSKYLSGYWSKVYKPVCKSKRGRC